MESKKIISSQSNEAIATKKKPNKTIFIAAAIAIATTIILIQIILLCVVFKHPYTLEDQYCKSAECLRMSASLMYSIDENVDPCEDFYKSTCGKYIENYYYESDKAASTSYLLRSRLLTNNKVRKFIKSNRSSTWMPEKTMRSYYTKCMHSDKKKNAEDILKELKRIGGFPILGNSKISELNSLLQNLSPILSHRLGIIRFSLLPISKKKGFQIHLRPGINKNQFQFIQNNNKTLIDALSTFSILNGAKKSKTHITRDFEKMLEIGNHFQNLDVIDKKIKKERATLKQLKKVSKLIKWEPIIETLAPGKRKEYYATSYIYNSPAFGNSTNNLDNIIKKLDKEGIANWIVFQYFLELLNIPLNPIKQLELENKCIDNVIKHFPSVVGRGYIEENVEEEKIQEIRNMIQNIKISFKEWIITNNWMDDDTRQAATDKVENMDEKVGYPHDLKNENYLVELYSKLNIDENMSLVKMNQMIMTWKTRNSLDSVYEDKPIEFFTPLTAFNAFFLYEMNTFYITSAIIDDTVFSHNYPSYFNYGSIGIVIAHEIAHGFDSQGRMYNRDGELKNWWTKSARSKYNEIAKCFEEQYSGFKYPDILDTMNGTLTLNENIADNIGAMITSRTLRKLEKPKTKLFGMDKYSAEQIYFYAFAHTLCGSPITEHLRIQKAKDVHAMARFRVNGVASNMPEFATAFQCKLGTPMNPHKKCNFG